MWRCRAASISTPTFSHAITRYFQTAGRTSLLDFLGFPEWFARSGEPLREAQEIQQRGASCGLEIMGDGVAETSAVEMIAPRQRHVANHIEGRGQHRRNSSARPPAGASRSPARSAVAVMAGASATTLRWVKTGATAWRCHFHSAPSALNRLSPMAGPASAA